MSSVGSSSQVTLSDTITALHKIQQEKKWGGSIIGFDDFNLEVVPTEVEDHHLGLTLWISRPDGFKRGNLLFPKRDPEYDRQLREQMALQNKLDIHHWLEHKRGLNITKRLSRYNRRAISYLEGVLSKVIRLRRQLFPNKVPVNLPPRSYDSTSLSDVGTSSALQQVVTTLNLEIVSNWPPTFL